METAAVPRSKNVDAVTVLLPCDFHPLEEASQEANPAAAVAPREVSPLTRYRFVSSNKFSENILAVMMDPPWLWDGSTMRRNKSMWTDTKPNEMALGYTFKSVAVVASPRTCS